MAIPGETHGRPRGNHLAKGGEILMAIDRVTVRAKTRSPAGSAPRHHLRVIVRERCEADAAVLPRISERVHALDGYPPYLPNGDLRVLLFATRRSGLGSWK